MKGKSQEGEKKYKVLAQLANLKELKKKNKRFSPNAKDSW